MRGKDGVTPETLMRMATVYLARHSASTDRVREVLSRKIVRRLAAHDADVLDKGALRSMIDPVLERLTQTGLLDDAVYARGKAASLKAKGRPAWRIRAELAQAGVDAGEVGLGATLDAIDPLAQAMVWARRRRLGPYRSRDRDLHRRRDVASVVRAGFSVSLAMQVVDATELPE